MSAVVSHRKKWPRLVRAGGIILLIALLGVLFIRAEPISSKSHYAYLESLYRVQRTDAKLSAAVLASYSRLLHNYDLLARYLADIRTEEATLRNIPDGLPQTTRETLQFLVEQLMESQRDKERDINLFERGNSVLRNSQTHFPEAAEAVMRQTSRQLPELRHFLHNIMALSTGIPVTDRESLKRQLSELRRLHPQGGKDQSIYYLLAHAEQIIERQPEVDILVKSILDPTSRTLLDDVLRVYTDGYEETQRLASSYRLVLYFVTLLLVAYALYALYRFERDRRQLATAHDELADRYAAQQAAERQLRLYATVFTHAAEGMAITDTQSRIIAVNPAFKAITGYAAEEVIGQTPAVLQSGQQGGDFYRAMWTDLLTHGHWQGEIFNRHKSGHIVPEWLSITAVPDNQGATAHYVGIFTDISERKESEERIRHMAHHDVLTGLPNRLLLEDRATQAIRQSKRHGKLLALVFIDLDRFKNINDTLGHEIGDQLLIQAAQRGLGVLRESDTLSRQGGDEFVVILPELERPEDAVLAVKKLLLALSRPYQLAGHELTVTGSAGIALYPDHGHDVSELLRKADAAMYQAKAEGRNTWCLFSADVGRTSLGELVLENDLYGAMERGELLMYYQPKIDTASGKLAGMEALMRWRHPERGMVSPGTFIPIAEANGLIKNFDTWALHAVCAQQRAWLDAGLTAVPVAVNLSAQQFADHNLPQLVADTLAAYRLPARLIELELTESLLMKNAGRAADVLEKLNQLDIRVAIDDFGTGYSSLSYLKQFPVQVLKIDRSFVRGIDEDGEPVKLAAAIIAMAHELNLEVVAEGVEKEYQRDYLSRHGCDLLQGYLFGHPQPAADLVPLLADEQEDLACAVA
ncbi:MAG: EAL domain-containing protein [Azonexus sp.]|jgi:diguanylate cyclase (GGDEF)-like protein/PAS domain S-box-containing protein|nr:EAL domain-containing protein [Azonexus sp.]